MKLINKGKPSYATWMLGLLVLVLGTFVACSSSKNKTSASHEHEGHEQHMKYYEITLKKGVNPKLIEKDFGNFDARNLGKASKSQEIYKYSFHIHEGMEAKFKDALKDHPGIAEYELYVNDTDGKATKSTGTKGGKVKIGK